MKIDSSRVVAITGASRGIGRAAAVEFARRGAKVVLLSRDENRLNDVAQEVRSAGGIAMVMPCDVSNETECKSWLPKVLERFSRIDVLVNNAGYGHYSLLENLSTESLDRIFRTNLMGTIWCTQSVIPQMRKQKAGHIVNVSTIISKRSIPFMTAYCMTKFAMNAMDEGLRLELKKDGIGVTLVCPGVTSTDFQSNASKTGIYPPLDRFKGMSAQAVGKAIARAVECNRRRVSLTLSGKILVGLNRISPWLVDEILDRTFVKSAQL